jgi:hypothetical protein
VAPPNVGTEVARGPGAPTVDPSISDDPTSDSPKSFGKWPVLIEKEKSDVGFSEMAHSTANREKVSSACLTLP